MFYKKKLVDSLAFACLLAYNLVNSTTTNAFRPPTHSHTHIVLPKHSALCIYYIFSICLLQICICIVPFKHVHLHFKNFFVSFSVSCFVSSVLGLA